MADMPGALLLRAGVLRPADLAAAAALREREGGSFGECLVRLGFVDEEQLAEFYQTRLMIPRVPDHRLVDVPKKVLALVPGDMAAEFRVLPRRARRRRPRAGHGRSHRQPRRRRGRLLRRSLRRARGRHRERRSATASSATTACASPRRAPPTRAHVARPARPARRRRRRPTRAQPVAAAADRRNATPRAAAPKPSKEALEEQIVLLTKVKYSDATPLPMPVPPPDDYQPSYAPKIRARRVRDARRRARADPPDRQEGAPPPRAQALGHAARLRADDRARSAAGAPARRRMTATRSPPPCSTTWRCSCGAAPSSS